MVATQRSRLGETLRDLGIDVAPSQANLLWVRADGIKGADLAHRLERHGIVVAPGAPLGDAARVRAAVHRPEAADRLVRALELARRA
jgi:histidinol-phosphate aminotransferase